MELWLFDTSESRRQAWGRVCQQLEMDFVCFDFLTTSIKQPSSQIRVVILDCSVTGSPLETLEQLACQFSRNLFAFTLEQCDCDTAVRLMEAGIAWVWEHNSTEEKLTQGMQRLLAKAYKRASEFQQLQQIASLFNCISVPEWEVFRLLIQGQHNHQIATTLSISIRTVEARRARIYRKCNVNTVAELVRRWMDFERLKATFGELNSSDSWFPVESISVPSPARVE